MIAQISIMEINDWKDAFYKLKINKKGVIQYANKFCENMVGRGGGVVDFRFRELKNEKKIPEILVLELIIDV